jgi:hypothetical protein
VLQASVRKAWFADSQFSSGQGQADREAPVVLQDRVHRIRVGRASSGVVRTQQALRGLVVIRLVLEWVE